MVEPAALPLETPEGKRIIYYIPREKAAYGVYRIDPKTGARTSIDRITWSRMKDPSQMEYAGDVVYRTIPDPKIEAARRRVEERAYEKEMAEKRGEAPLKSPSETWEDYIARYGTKAKIPSTFIAEKYKEQLRKKAEEEAKKIEAKRPTTTPEFAASLLLRREQKEVEEAREARLEKQRKAKAIERWEKEEAPPWVVKEAEKELIKYPRMKEIEIEAEGKLWKFEPTTKIIEKKVGLFALGLVMKAEPKPKVLPLADYLYGKAKRFIAEKEYKMELGRIKGAGAVLTGVGLIGVSYGVGVVKGLTFPIRPKFYKEELPALISVIKKPSKLYGVGKELAKKPWLISEMVGYGKGAKRLMKEVTTPMLKPSMKPLKPTKVPEKYLKEVGKAEPSIEIEKMGLFKYIREKMRGRAVSVYKPPKLKVKKRISEKPFEWLKLTTREKKISAEMKRGYEFGYAPRPERIIEPPKPTAIKKPPVPSKAIPSKPLVIPARISSMALEKLGKRLLKISPFEKVKKAFVKPRGVGEAKLQKVFGRRQELILIEQEPIYMKPKKMELVFPSLKRIKAIGITRAVAPKLLSLTQIGRLAQVTGATQIQRQLLRQQRIQRQVDIQKQLSKTIQVSKQISTTTQIQIQRQVQRQVQAQVQRQVQAQKQVQRQVQAQKQIQRQLLRQVQVLKLVEVPELFIPKLPTTLKPIKKIKRKKRKPFDLFPTYKPSLVGIWKYKKFGITIPKAPEFVSLGERPLTKGMIEDIKKIGRRMI